MAAAAGHREPDQIPVAAVAGRVRPVRTVVLPVQVALVAFLTILTLGPQMAASLVWDLAARRHFILGLQQMALLNTVVQREEQVATESE